MKKRLKYALAILFALTLLVNVKICRYGLSLMAATS